MAKTILLPKRDLWTYTTVGQHPLLEPSHQTPTRHHTHGQLQGWHRPLADREDHCIIGPSRSFEDLQTFLHISSQALPSSINAVINDEYGTISAPRNVSILYTTVLVLLFDSLVECKVIVVDLGFVHDVEFWREEQQLARFAGDSKVLLVGGPAACQDAIW